MEYFRWILLLAGVLLLVFIYFSGRSKKNDASYTSTRMDDEGDPLFSDDPGVREISGFDDLNLSQQSNAFRTERGQLDEEWETSSISPMEPEVLFDESLDIESDVLLDMDLDVALNDDDVPVDYVVSDDKDNESKEEEPQPRLIESISEKIESFSALLSPRRKDLLAASAGRVSKSNTKPGDEKIISLHVMAPEGDLINGAYLQAIFNQRGYTFGEMKLFHSRYKDQTIFSIVNVVEPGNFEIDDIENFKTPGITLFLRLPGSIAADVLFEVLVSEATDIADALGVKVLDSDRCTLTKQTIQHMREDMYDFMHRQKYFKK